jgi:hypothetical protein
MLELLVLLDVEVQIYFTILKKPIVFSYRDNSTIFTILAGSVNSGCTFSVGFDAAALWNKLQ